MSKVEDHEGKQVYVINKKAYVELTWARDMQKAIERVRELHKLRIEVNQNGFSNDTCDGCYDEDSSTGEQFHHDYPCPTIKALDGEQ